MSNKAETSRQALLSIELGQTQNRTRKTLKKSNTRTRAKGTIHSWYIAQNNHMDRRKHNKQRGKTMRNRCWQLTECELDKG